MANYSILGCNGSLANLKLFVHADHLPMLPKTNDGWKNVEYSFWPSEQAPDRLQLVFQTSYEQEPYLKNVSVALPKEADALECIATRQIFAVSQSRLVALHRYCVRDHANMMHANFVALMDPPGPHMLLIYCTLKKSRNLPYFIGFLWNPLPLLLQSADVISMFPQTLRNGADR